MLPSICYAIIWSWLCVSCILFDLALLKSVLFVNILTVNVFNLILFYCLRVGWIEIWNQSRWDIHL